MRFIPRKQRHAKMFKGHLLNNSPKCMGLSQVYNGGVHLVSLEAGRIKPQHLEFLNLRVKKELKKNVNICIKSFPHVPVSAKPLEVRMGKGKGSTSYWAANIFSGTSILEAYTAECDAKVIINTLKNLKKKLPIHTSIIYKK